MYLTNIILHRCRLRFGDSRQRRVERGESVDVANSTILGLKFIPQSLCVTSSNITNEDELSATKIREDERESTIPTFDMSNFKSVSLNPFNFRPAARYPSGASLLVNESEYESESYM